jgi:hypothetical protein
MILGRDAIETLCRNSPGLRVWILEEDEFLHFETAASERRCRGVRGATPLSKSAASERRERASGAERADEAASERRCRGVRGAKPLG